MNAPPPRLTLPDGPLVAWYGDDFTGSAAVMEVLTFAGFPSVLFFGVPTAQQRAKFGDLRGIGIAGEARSRSPQWMVEHLPPVFAALRATGAPVVHYKTCSTFDSSPTIGSIGKAARIALDGANWSPAWTPLLVGAPAIGRWQAFGNLFAAAGDTVHRLDRHPTMSVHPSTPMDEADVRRHLAKQTGRSVGLVDLVAMKTGRADLVRAAEEMRHEIIALDVIDEETLREAGRLVWQDARQRFAIGSQGVEYALVAHWAAAGIHPSPPSTALAPAERVAAISGSCSPLTAEQIAHAASHGFAAIALDAAKVADRAAWDGEIANATEGALKALSEGKDPIVFSAKGPDDPAIAAFKSATADDADAAVRLGEGLGAVLAAVVRNAKLRRAAIAGGDTSSAAARALGLYAVTAKAALAPGAPILCGHGDGDTDGLELALKGGQMGPPSFFSDLRAGANGVRT